MKKILFLLVLFIAGSLSAALLKDDGRPVAELVELFKTLDIIVEPTALDMNKYAQENFLRKRGTERWEMDFTRFEDKRSDLMPVLKRLDFIEERHAENKLYDHVIIAGATIERMRMRSYFLYKEYKVERVDFNAISFLTGERYLSSERETKGLLFDPNKSAVPFRSDWVHNDNLELKTEYDAAKLAWDQVIPDETLRDQMKDENFINAKRREGTLRVNTEDTVYTWLDTNPKVGSVLLVTNNPYVLYQDLVVRRILDDAGWFEKGGSLETIGSEASEALPIVIILDSLARCLYMEFNDLEKRKLHEGL